MKNYYCAFDLYPVLAFCCHLTQFSLLPFSLVKLMISFVQYVCGSCRQVIAEFGYSCNCLILLVKPSGEYKETAITELLPEPFTRHVLSGKHKKYCSYHCGIVDNYNMLHAHVRAIVLIFSNAHSARASHLSYHIFFFLQYKYVITLRLSFLVFKRH